MNRLRRRPQAGADPGPSVGAFNPIAAGLRLKKLRRVILATSATRRDDMSAYGEQEIFVQMRSPFTGRWLKINPDNGAIVEVALVAWQDIPHLPVDGTAQDILSMVRRRI
jgi:hypothetical protein